MSLATAAPFGRKYLAAPATPSLWHSPMDSYLNNRRCPRSFLSLCLDFLFVVNQSILVEERLVERAKRNHSAAAWNNQLDSVRWAYFLQGQSILRKGRVRVRSVGHDTKHDQIFLYSVMERKILGKYNTTRKYRKGLLIEKKIKREFQIENILTHQFLILALN